MALAMDRYAHWSNLLRFLLFEIGIGYTPKTMDSFILQAKNLTTKLVFEQAEREDLSLPISYSLEISEMLKEFKKLALKKHTANRFLQWDKIEQYWNKLLVCTALKIAWNTRNHRESANTWEITEDSMSLALYSLSQHYSEFNPQQINAYEILQRNERELLQYSASFQAKIPLLWLAVSIRGFPNQQKSQELNSILQRYYYSEYIQWQQKLSYITENPENYLALPMHPWFWRKIKPDCTLLHNAIPISIPQHVHVINIMEHLSDQSAERPWMRFFRAPAENVLDQTEYAHVHDILKRKSAVDSLLLLPLLSSVLIPIHGSSPLISTLQQNPHSLVSRPGMLLPLNALINEDMEDSHKRLRTFLQNTKMCAMDFFTHYLRALIAPSLEVLLKTGIALTLNPSSCLLEWSEEKQTFGVWVINTEIRKHSSASQECLQQTCAHWQYHLLQKNIQTLILYMSRSYSLSPAVLWHQVKKIILHFFEKKDTNGMSSLLRKQILEDSWPERNILRSILNPQEQEYRLARVQNQFTI